MNPIDQFAEDIEDYTVTRASRFALAESIEGHTCRFVQAHPELLEQAIQRTITFWDKRRPPSAGHGGAADSLTIQALISSVRQYASGGS